MTDLGTPSAAPRSAPRATSATTPGQGRHPRDVRRRPSAASGFEAATFGDAQPRHWQTVTRRKRLQRQSRLNRTPDPSNLEQTQLVAVSGAGRLPRVDEAVRRPGGGRPSPTPSAPSGPTSRGSIVLPATTTCRSQDGSLLAAGPAPRRRTRASHAPDWPMDAGPARNRGGRSPEAVSRIPAHSNLHDGVRGSLKRASVRGPRELRPGSPASVAAWAESAAQGPGPNRNRRCQARSLTRPALQDGRRTIPDYDSARQIAWAFRVIYRESVPTRPSDTAIERVLADLEAQLALDLPPRETTSRRSRRHWRNGSGAVREFDPGCFPGSFRPRSLSDER